jgi:hypothetical protein
MVEFFRTKLFEEQLKLADADSNIKNLNRIIDNREQLIQSLHNELEGYHVPTQAEDSARAKD